MNMKRMTAAAVAVGLALAAKAEPLKVVQLDLARQMETTTFLSNYIDRVAALGYNAIQFYIEGRVATKTFALPKGECYTEAEMRGLVAHAAEKGLLSIPVVSPFGHGELFFRHPGREDMCEARQGNPRLGNGKDCFCLSQEKTREFFRSYFAEIAAIFPGPYFHAGFDEAWNEGLCDLCAPKEAKDELFSECVLFAHDALAKLGKRMWMWDDFFEFHPKAYAKMPKDIVMCHWIYDTKITSSGTRGHFDGRIREDTLAKYEREGRDALPVCWYRTENIRQLLGYARRHRTLGYVVTQWEEMQARFHGGSLPRVAAAEMIFSNPEKYQVEDAFVDACRKVYPSLTYRETLAAATLLHADTRFPSAGDAANVAGYPSVESATAIWLATDTILGSALKPGTGAVDADPLCERALLDDLVLRGSGAVIDFRLRRAVRQLTDPRRTAGDVKAAKASVASARRDLLAIIARRRLQREAWRKGCDPEQTVKPLESVVAYMDGLLALPDAPAPADEKRLEVTLSLVDYHGMPKWKVFGRFGDEWRELAKGIWKPGIGDEAHFTKYFTFKSAEFPSELRIEHNGYGKAMLNYISVEDRERRVCPKKVLAVSGNVVDPENILRDDLEWVRFGTPGFLAQFYDAEKEKAVSSLTVGL